MKKAINFYLKYGVKPEGYGFEKSENGMWVWRSPYLRCGLTIDPVTMRISSLNGYCTQNIAVLLEMARNQNILTDGDYTERNYVMRLTKEEAEAIEKMRGHPTED